MKIIANTKYISSWKSKGLSDETIKPPATSDKSLTAMIHYHGNKKLKWVKLKGTISRQPKILYTHRTIVNNYIGYELVGSGSNDNDPTLRKCLFSVVTLTKSADIDKYGYSGYGIGFDKRLSFSFPGGGFGQKLSEKDQHKD